MAMVMKKIGIAALALLALAAGGAAIAQMRFTDAEIVGAIGKCMIENAPENWQTVIFTLDEVPAAAGKKASTTVSHKVVVGSENSPPQDVKPCRPDYAAKAANTFRENQDEKARGWTGVTVTLQRDRRYSIAYRYPK
jgi:hypothetical protein